MAEKYSRGAGGGDCEVSLEGQVKWGENSICTKMKSQERGRCGSVRAGTEGVRKAESRIRP